MGIVLSVHSENAFKEFVLPYGKDREQTLCIRRDVFGLPSNLTLNLENDDGLWYFSELAQGKMTRNGSPYAREPLQDGDYLTYRRKNEVHLAILVRAEGEELVSYTKYRLLTAELSIGTAADCALCYSFQNSGNQYITRHHAQIAVGSQGLTLTDKSANGVFVNDIRVHGSVHLAFGDRIDIWGLSMMALGNILAIRPNDNLTVDAGRLAEADLPEQALQDSVPEKIRYHRSPRKIGKLVTGKIEIEAPPAPQKEEEMPLLLTIGPALSMALPMVAGSVLAVIGSSMGGVYMYTGIVTSVLSAVVGAVWAIVNVTYSRKNRKEKEKLRFAAYSDYLIRLTEKIQADYQHNRQVLLAAYPTAEQCLQDGYREQHLWERNGFHSDFLCYRLGLGNLPFQKEIHIPAEKFDMVQDSLKEKPRMIQENFQTLHQVPVCVDLRQEHLVGLVGGPDLAGARSILQNLVAQIAVQNCYTDVKLVFLYREDQGDDPAKWEYCRWLPHVWSEDHKTRFVASGKNEATDVLYEIAGVLRARNEQRRAGTDGRSLYKPWYIVVLEDSSILENEPAAKYLLDPKQDLGVTTLFLADRAEDLPNACECVIRWDRQYAGIYHTRAAEMESGRVQMETVPSMALERLARYLCNVEVNEVELGGEIPNSVTFFAMYGVDRPEELNAAERWKHNRTYENMRALIGQKSGGQPCYLDAHEKYHGPHGLVAGTTGSGKSETLQTYILSLALNFSPYDVAFFLIDYKGGGMANMFRKLPHTLGTISNLSGSQIQRAMVSIKSENLRRQRIFNEHDVNNINAYTELFKNGEAGVPLPHLFIVIDEFAELKREEPEFMRELISVAQVGRSLGVHLILATQKPNGTVDENIASNAKFRLCLRVQDRQDSMDMLHKPDAAYLTQAGRGYLQVGSDEVFELFQSGWSGAGYDAETAGSKQVLARMLTASGKTAVLGSYAKRKLKENVRIAWLNQLAELCDSAAAGPGQEGKSSPQRQVDTLYELIARDGIDFAVSESNTQALHNLLNLVSEASKTGYQGKTRGGWMAVMAAQRDIRLPEKKAMTQLDATVDYLETVARQQGYQTLPPLWLPPLPAELYLDQMDNWQEETYRNGNWPSWGRRWELSAVIGRADDPAHQSQLPAALNFSQGGHYALIGAASSGKSTFVQTLLYSLIQRYSPEYLNVYVLDYSSRMTQPFLQAPHVGGVLFEDAPAQAGKLFYLLRAMIQERKNLFQGGTYDQYILAHGVVCPAVLLIIDNIANFREKTAEAYDDELIRLAREGASYGLYLLITGAGFSISEIPGRLADNLRSTLCLELADVYQYGDALRTAQPPVRPEAGVHGRGLIRQDGRILEFQTALALPAADMYERGRQIEEQCRIMHAGWTGRCARPVPIIPAKPKWNDLLQREEMPALLAGNRYLPIGYEYATAGIYSLDLRHTFCYVVSGRARSGKTNTLKLLMRAAYAKKMRLSVLEPKGVDLQGECEQLGADRFSTLEELVNFIWELGRTFQERNAVKMSMVADGVEEDAQFERMSREQPWLVVISDLTAFVNLATSDEATRMNVGKSMTNLFNVGFLHNIYFAAAFNQDERGQVMGKDLYEAFVKDRDGIHLGGNAANQQLFEFAGMPFSQQSQPEKPGVGLVPPRDGEPYRKVILPLAKG